MVQLLEWYSTGPRLRYEATQFPTTIALATPSFGMGRCNTTELEASRGA